MKKQAGIWIDHKEAFVVFVAEGAQPEQRMQSGIEKHVRYSGHAASQEGSADDQRDRQFAAHLVKYYDEVISHVRDADSILIFGPGEAKGELEKRLASKGLGMRVVGVEAADKMTDHQIAAKVRQHYQKPADALAP
jgi:stalled ribosome rescue protein Dom34